MADDKITRSKISEKDHRKDTEDDQEVGANSSGPKAEDTSKEKSKATTQAKNTEEEEEEVEEATKKKLKELQTGVGDHARGLERETNKSVRGKGIADSSGGEIEHASEIQSSETEMPLETDDDEKSEFDLEIDTNMEGLKEEVAQRTRKGKAKLEEEGKELDDDPEPEVVSNIEGPVRAMRELYRQVTEGIEGKLARLVNREEYTSEDEESELESELNRKCEMLLKTPLHPMLELDTEIRGLLEELEVLITSKDDKAGPKLRALRAELEALKESNYQKEVEVIGMVKGLIDDGAEEESVIDAEVYSGVGPMVEEAQERIDRVRLEIEEVEMDRKKSFGCCGGLNVDFLLNWK